MHNIAMHSHLKLLFLFLTFLAGIYPFVVFDGFWSYRVQNIRILRNNAKSFEILSHPVSIIGARELVEHFRYAAQSQTTPLPLNLKYRNVSFGPQSMEACENSGFKDPLDLLIIIKSAPNNIEQREIHRDTWANEDYLSKFGDHKIRYGFITGEPSSDEAKESLEDEADEYGDLILANFTDTYQNITYKTMAGFKWAVKFCPYFKFYVSLDDDTFISITNVLQYLKPLSNSNASGGEKNAGSFISHNRHLFAGHPAGNLKPIREKSRRWYLSEEEYPFEKLSPYILGYFVLMSWKTVQSFYYISPYVRELSIDDVYLGKMANELRIPVVKIPNVFMTQYRVNFTSLSCHLDSNFSTDYVAVHGFGYESERKTAWRTLNCLIDLKKGKPPTPN